MWYSEILNKSTGTIEKNPPKYLAVRTFFAVLLAIIQELEMLYWKKGHKCSKEFIYDNLIPIRKS